MAVTGSTDLGGGLKSRTIDHDPTSVATDAPKGAILIDASGVHWLKLDDGLTTNVIELRDPNVHKDSHRAGGADAFVAADLLEATVRRVQEADGPTTLLFGNVLDGEFLKRSGTSVVGDAGAGDTLPVPDTTAVVKGSVDDTKLVRIEADGLTTGTTRVLSMPDSDITPDDAGAARTPLTHKDTHKSAGGDAFAAADLLEAAVKRIQTSTGPTILTVGAIAEAEALIRVGSTLVGSPRIAENLYLKVRNETGAQLDKGDLVAAVGFSVGEDRILVDISDKDDPTKRPAIGILTENIADNSNSDLLLSVGSLTGIDTSMWSVNDQLVLGDDGALSRPPPEVDPFTGEVQLVGSVSRVHATLGSVFVTLGSGLQLATAAQFFATKEITPSGSISGGEVTRSTGLNVAVAAGTGYVNDGTDLFRVTWSAVANLLLTASTTNFIYVDENGVVQDSTSEPSNKSNILLAEAITDGASILLLSSHPTILEESPAQFHDYAKDVIGNIVVSGLMTAKDAIAYRLEVDAGVYYSHDFRSVVPATDPITFTYWYRDGGGGWTRVVAQTLIDEDNWDDGTGTLNSLVATEWKKDLLFVVYTASGVVEYHIFYGQEVFASQSEAESGNLPSAASDVITNGVRSGGIVIEGAAASIASVVDVRPFLGQLAPGTTAVTDHGLLSGLADDDHMQYILASGTRAMTGDLDMGAQAIINVGNVDGVDVSAHAARHQNAGADEISVVGLSGELADDQPPKDHKANHISGGGDAFASTDVLEAIGKRIQTTTGPTTMLVGAVADGEFLKRSGTALVGDTPSPVPEIHVPIGGEFNAHFEGVSATFVVAGRFIFRGTTAYGGSHSAAKFILYNSESGGSHYARLYDLTNSNEVAIVGPFSGQTPAIQTDASLVNLPTGEAIFEVQVRDANSKKVDISEMLLVP